MSPSSSDLLPDADTPVPVLNRPPPNSADPPHPEERPIPMGPVTNWHGPSQFSLVPLRRKNRVRKDPTMTQAL